MPDAPKSNFFFIIIIIINDRDSAVLVIRMTKGMIEENPKVAWAIVPMMLPTAFALAPYSRLLVASYYELISV